MLTNFWEFCHASASSDHFTPRIWCFQLLTQKLKKQQLQFFQNTETIGRDIEWMWPKLEKRKISYARRRCKMATLTGDFADLGHHIICKRSNFHFAAKLFGKGGYINTEGCIRNNSSHQNLILGIKFVLRWSKLRNYRSDRVPSAMSRAFFAYDTFRVSLYMKGWLRIMIDCASLLKVEVDYFIS